MQYDPKSPANAENSTDSMTPTAEAAVNASEGAQSSTQQPGIEEEVLVEEVSIDGMCGVY